MDSATRRAGAIAPRALIFLLFCAAIALASRPAAADLYAYTDAAGVLQITNRPRGDHRYRIFVKSPRSTPRDVIPSAPSDRSPDRATRYAPLIHEAAEAYDVSEHLIRAVIACESDYDPHAVSPAGAAGLMQLMPETARSLDVRDVFDPRDAIFGGTRYLRLLSDRFEGDLPRVVAAYNAGEGAVERYAGIPPYEETRGYVARVLSLYERYRARGDSP